MSGSGFIKDGKISMSIFTGRWTNGWMSGWVDEWMSVKKIKRLSGRSVKG